MGAALIGLGLVIAPLVGVLPFCSALMAVTVSGDGLAAGSESAR